MADGGPPALQPRPAVPAQPATLVYPSAEPAKPDPLAPQTQPIHLPLLKWSHFTPEFAGKANDDAEVHLLHTNNWMETHNFPDNVKVKRFCLMLIGEARLWYESMRLIESNWQRLQVLFRQLYSKIGSMREQLFHGWKSFHYDENVETLDAHVAYIRKVAMFLGYGE